MSPLALVCGSTAWGPRPGGCRIASDSGARSRADWLRRAASAMDQPPVILEIGCSRQAAVHTDHGDRLTLDLIALHFVERVRMWLLETDADVQVLSVADGYELGRMAFAELLETARTLKSLDLKPECNV